MLPEHSVLAGNEKWPGDLTANHSLAISDRVTEEAGDRMPVNKGENRALDCAVVKYIHQSNKGEKKKAYDTIRCAFSEGMEVYPGTQITTRLHIQIRVLNRENIKGYFLPRPLEKFNPYLKQEKA